MVNVCIVSVIAQMYLYAVSEGIIRFRTKPDAINEKYQWIFVPDPTLNADRICNVEFKTCIAVGKDRALHDYEVLMLEEANQSNSKQFWVYDTASKTISLKENKYYWDLQHDNITWEPLEIYSWASVNKADTFQLINC